VIPDNPDEQLRFHRRPRHRWLFVADLVIAGFSFQCNYLGFGQFDTLTGRFFFLRFQAFFEVFKIVAQPDRTDATS